MILAEKIIDLRKKMNWSQEELAEQLGVSRQSVSKWESAQSIPDMDKIVKMSTIFSVSTDYLLKDEMEPSPEIIQDQTTEPGVRKVTMAEASSYMDKRRKSAPLMGFSAALCVASPILLIFLLALTPEGLGLVSETLAVSVGISILIAMIAIAVIGFIRCWSRTSEFEFLEKENIETEYGVSGLVKKNREEFKETSTRCILIGTVLCILSVIPLIVSSIVYSQSGIVLMTVSLLLLMISIAVYLFVYSGTITGSYEKLLEDGDYSRENKEKAKKAFPFSSVYWCISVAIGLVLQFSGFEYFWAFYAVAGVLFVPIRVIVIHLMNK